MSEEKAKYTINEEDLPKLQARCHVVTQDYDDVPRIRKLQFLEPPPKELLARIGRFAAVVDTRSSDSRASVNSACPAAPWSEFSVYYSPFYIPGNVTSYICDVLMSEYGDEVLVNQRPISQHYYW